MKYAITVDGSYKALVEIEMGEKNWSDDQGFSGRVTTDQWGVCQIEKGRVQPDGSLFGCVTLSGHYGEFTAKISGQEITGEIRGGRTPFGWVVRKPFDGLETT